MSNLARRSDADVVVERSFTSGAQHHQETAQTAEARGLMTTATNSLLTGIASTPGIAAATTKAANESRFVLDAGQPTVTTGARLEAANEAKIAGKPTFKKKPTFPTLGM